MANLGTSDHLITNLNSLSVQSQYKGSKQVTVGNGQNLPINHIGNTSLSTKYHNFLLKDVLHVPRIAMNLLSIYKFCLHNNCSCHFDANKLTIQDVPTGRIIYKGFSENGVYPVYPKLLNSTSPQSVSSSFTQSNHSPSQLHNSSIASFHIQKSHKWLLWHHKLGHPSDSVLRTALSSLPTSDVCNKLVSVSDSHYKHCLSGKMHQLPFNKSEFVTSKPLELVHSDVWGLAPVTSINDFRYYLVFVDDFSKFSWLYLLKHKSDVFDVFKYFKAYVENQLHTSLKILRTDGGGEFTSTAFHQFCSKHGIIHQTSCPHTPQQNSTPERKHRRLVKCSLTMLSHSSLPLS